MVPVWRVSAPVPVWRLPAPVPTAGGMPGLKPRHHGAKQPSILLLASSRDSTVGSIRVHASEKCNTFVLIVVLWKNIWFRQKITLLTVCLGHNYFFMWFINTKVGLFVEISGKAIACLNSNEIWNISLQNEIKLIMIALLFKGNNFISCIVLFFYASFIPYTCLRIVSVLIK